MTVPDDVPATESRPNPAGLIGRPRWQRWGHKVLGYGFGIFCLCVIWFMSAMTIMFSGPEVPPVATFGIAAGLGFVVVAFGLLRRKHSVMRLILAIAVYGLFLATLVGLQADDVNQFKAAYRAIRVGMTDVEVRAVVDAHFKNRTMKIRFYPGGCFVGPLDPNSGGFDAEYFSVSFKDGLVIDKQYLPD